jgi:enolase
VNRTGIERVFARRVWDSRGRPTVETEIHFAGNGNRTMPLPEIQIFRGGAHAGRRVNIHDFMIVAVGADN